MQIKITVRYHINQRRPRQPTPGLLPGESQGRRSLVGYSPWDRKELDTTELLHFTDFTSRGFPGDAVVKIPPANAGDTGLILGVEKIL